MEMRRVELLSKRFFKNNSTKRKNGTPTLFEDDIELSDNEEQIIYKDNSYVLMSLTIMLWTYIKCKQLYLIAAYF